MLVTFRTKAYANITLFGDVAIQLLKLMGHSGTVPGALRPEEIPAALRRLREGLARLEAQTPPPSGDDPDQEPPVSVAHRALPLQQLLEAAAREEAHVMWDKG